MKYRWRVVWSDGRVDTCHYAVELSIAEQGARKCVRWRRQFTIDGAPAEVVRVEFLPEE